MINDNQWDLIIRPKGSWRELNLQDLWRYRDLIWLFVKRDIAVVYKQTILGPLWFFIQPLFSSVIFTIVFGRIAQIATDGIPHYLFYLSGLVCWNYFSDCLISTSNTFTANSHLFGKVYFPRLVIPISIVISHLGKFFIQSLMLIGFYIYFFTTGAQIHPGGGILLLPALILQMALLGLGFGLLVSSLTTKYRDLGMLLGFGMQLWMYATPIVYPISQVPQKYHYLYALNPMASVVLQFRSAIFGTDVNMQLNGVAWIITALIFVAGMSFFNRAEQTFVDTV